MSNETRGLGRGIRHKGGYSGALKGQLLSHNEALFSDRKGVRDAHQDRKEGEEEIE